MKVKVTAPAHSAGHAERPVRDSYHEAIMRLLEKADARQVRLVWTYARHLIR